MSNLAVSRAQRLDQRLVEMFPILSRGHAVRLIEESKVTVNGALQTKAGFKLKPNDIVTADFDVGQMSVIPEIDLPIIYEDDDCVVINKPVGLLSHSKGAFNPEATVATWLRSRLQAGMTGDRGGIVHRLDRATSGVMICAKTPAALSALQKQFSQRKAKKAYLACISGQLDPSSAVIDMPIERNPKAPATFRVGPNGKPAITQYETLKADTSQSLLLLRPTTGRTHQLRVHLKQLGHPIIGDKLYDGKPADRLLLHALSLEITTPDRVRRTFTALPDKIFDYGG